MPDIGILSGIPFTNSPYKQAFDAGFGGAPSYAFPFEEGFGYNNARFDAGLLRLNTNFNPPLRLIVVVGGIVAEKRAVANPQRDTISLVGGGSPPNPGGRFRNRISLESANSDPLRLAHLATLHFNRQEICLLANPNASMTAQEQPIFATTVLADVGPQTANPQAVFRAAFGQIGPNIRAVVVSADPWFKQNSNVLVAEANSWATAGKRVCYPFQEYRNDGPTPGQTTLQGPSLIAAYNLLGQLAASVINGTAPPALQVQQLTLDI